MKPLTHNMREAAALVGVSQHSLRTAIARGELKAMRMNGTRLRVADEDLHRWLAQLPVASVRRRERKPRDEAGPE